MDFTLTEEQQRWRAVARDFAEQVIKPDVLRRDRLPTAAERIPWDWIRQADAAGLRTLAVPRAWGGAGPDIQSLCLAGEELAAGDLGFAVIMDQCWKMAHILGEAMTPAQQQRFIPPFVADPEATLAIGFTEEGAGSDHQGSRLSGHLGGASIMHDHPVEKYLRDAASFLHSDGTNQLCLLRAAQGLAGGDDIHLFGF